MDLDTRLRACAPKTLNTARALAHKAAQVVTAAATANLEPRPDYSHTSLAWNRDDRQFVSQPLSGPNGAVLVGLSLSPLRIDVIENDRRAATLELNGLSLGDAYGWLDLRLAEQGLQPASNVAPTSDLPPEVAAVDVFSTGDESDRLGCLADWFDLADRLLAQFAAKHSDLSPPPGPVLCWPHHFDIATYVQLQAGDSETAKGIGVGLSPGDESYDQPYFYINPWPHLDPTGLPDPPVPGHWHTAGFVGAIATGEEVLTLEDIPRDLPPFIERAFDIGRGQLAV